MLNESNTSFVLCPILCVPGTYDCMNKLHYCKYWLEYHIINIYD